MINLKYTYQPSKNLDEVNKQVTNLVELLKNELLQAATNENVESLVMKVEQTSDDGAKRLAEVNARVGDTAAIVGMMASYNSATGKITVEAGLKAGIEESNIVLSGDHIILDGDVTIQNGFMLSGSHITAGTITANEIDAYTITSAKIAAGAITADKINVGDLRALGATIGGWSIDTNGINSSGNYYSHITQSYGGDTAELTQGHLKISDGSSYETVFNGAGMTARQLNGQHTSEITYYGVAEFTNYCAAGYFNVFDSSGTSYFANINAATIRGVKLNLSDPGEGSSSTANCRITTGGWLMFVNGASSRRYKHNITKSISEEMDPHKLYDIDVVEFKYNEDYLSESDARYNKKIVGFIAEDVREKYPIACDIDEEDRAETWNERYIIPPMLALIQEQNKRIKRLEEAYVRDN